MSTFVGAFQSDGVHKLCNQPDDTVLVMSSTFDTELMKTIPLSFTLLFGQSKVHYQSHFRVLFGALQSALRLNEQGRPRNHSSVYVRGWMCMFARFCSAMITWCVCGTIGELPVTFGSTMDFSQAETAACCEELASALVVANPSMTFEAATKLSKQCNRGCMVSRLHICLCCWLLLLVSRSICLLGALCELSSACLCQWEYCDRRESSKI